MHDLVEASDRGLRHRDVDGRIEAVGVHRRIAVLNTWVVVQYIFLKGVESVSIVVGSRIGAAEVSGVLEFPGVANLVVVEIATLIHD